MTTEKELLKALDDVKDLADSMGVRRLSDALRGIAAVLESVVLDVADLKAEQHHPAPATTTAPVCPLCGGVLYVDAVDPEKLGLTLSVWEMACGEMGCLFRGYRVLAEDRLNALSLFARITGQGAK